jgi:tRNA(Ile)-lysidine synthase
MESVRVTGDGDLLSRVRETVRRYHMLAEGDTVVVGVSGGPDSTALLHVLGRMRGELRLSLHVAHFNHRLRRDAADDTASVAAVTREMGVPYHHAAGETRAHAKQMGLSLEDSARRLRYEFLTSVAQSVTAQVVATGHTRDDQAETVLMRLMRGSGLRGLGGIPPVRSLDGARLIRPLIDTGRAEIEAYLRAHSLSWREDPTNRDPAILRNWIRMVVLPTVEGYNPGVRQTLARLADLLRDDAEALDELAAPHIAAVLTPSPGGVVISHPPFARLQAALQRRALREAVRRVRGNVDRVAFVHVEAARRLVLEGQAGAEVELPGGVRVVRLSGSAEVTAEAEPAVADPGPEYRFDVPGSIVAPEFGVQIVAQDVEIAAPEVQARINHPSAEEIIVDGERVGRTLIVRGPRPGDRFAPIGMSGRTKKLSDCLSEEKVPLRRRRFMPVLTTADGAILWVIGVRAAESWVGTGTSRAVKIVARKLRA